MITEEECEERLAQARKQIMRTLRDSIMGAIVDLRSNPDQVQVMMYWSKEFYELIEKEGKPDAS